MARFNNPPAARFVYVYATANVGTADADGVGYNLREGEVWSADDPIVALHPGLFADTPPAPHFPRRTVAVEVAV
jgi:hypothetical protein